jgi:hypothetical protein
LGKLYSFRIHQAPTQIEAFGERRGSPFCAQVSRTAAYRTGHSLAMIFQPR